MDNQHAQPAAAPPKKSLLGKKLLIALGVVVALIGVLAVVIAMQPAEFQISRTATMAAPPEVVFEQVNDFHKWQAWSPWAKLDANMEQTYEGPPAGTGSSYHWVGDEVGEGRMTIMESRPNESVTIKLEFLKPYTATNTAEFTFKPEGEKTAVTWTMSGKNSFMIKAVHMFMNMDRLIGGMFDQGLASMKSVVETAPKQ